MGNFNSDPSPLPEKMDLFYIPNTLCRLGRLAGKLMMHLPNDGYPSTRGAEAMLAPEPFQPPRSIPGQQNFGFDDMGTYYEG